MTCPTCNDKGVVECDMGRSARLVPCTCVVIGLRADLDAILMGVHFGFVIPQSVINAVLARAKK